MGMSKQHSLGVIAFICICIGSSAAWSNLTMLGASPSETAIHFDQVFADASRGGEFAPHIHQRLREAGWDFNATTTDRGFRSIGDVSINRQRKSDRLPVSKSVLPEPVLLPNCEPAASRFADPVLGRIVSRCIV
jgi:hypothetical protein